MAPDQVIASGEKLEMLIPQKAPFVMVDKLISTDNSKTITGLTITENNFFTNNGFFTEPGLIENMAQSAAAKIGYQYQQINAPIPVGFIGAIKNLKIYKLPKQGMEITTEIVIDYEIQDFSLISGKVFEGSELLACCEMKIFLQKNNPNQ